MTTLVWISFGLAALPTVLYLVNRLLYRPPRASIGAPRPTVSVLIPARNEEASIGAAVRAALSSEGVDVEVVVLDDHSADDTADIVRRLAQLDPRVRLEHAPPLPEGWCGKQHACYRLSEHARFDLLAFVDADVRLAPDGLARMAGFLERRQTDLVSGIPRQETGTPLEKLVLPLIHFLLLGYLPMLGMRLLGWSAFGAGCGQLFLTRRAAYERVGGHAAVRTSLHDGVTLPRAYRRAGLVTDMADATGVATCRMYRSGREVWLGLAKNAREGLAAPRAIGVWTLLLALGHIAPWVLLALPATWAGGSAVWGPALAAALLPLAVRLDAARVFRQSLFGALLHPVGVLLLLGIQWDATQRAWRGRPVGWKGRPNVKEQTGVTA